MPRFAHLATLLILAATACAQTTQPAAIPPPGETVGATVARDESPKVTDADLSQVAADDRSFALDLYQILRKPANPDDKPANLFYSPYSISTALAMTYAGARGQTAEQMAKTLHFTLPPDRLHPAVNALDLRLTKPVLDDKGKPMFRLYVVNRLWGQTGEHFVPAFLDLLARDYGAAMNLLDFARQPEESRVEINTWIAKQTEDRIKDLLPPNSVANAKLVLTNAIYFKADWDSQFEKSFTKDAPFHLLDGQDVSVPTMHQEKSFRYFAAEGVQAVELPYRGQQLGMLIIVPEAGKFADYDAGLSPARLDTINGGLQAKVVSLSVPKFTYTQPCQLKPALSALGMPIAFSPAADFSGMGSGLFISDVYHKAFVLVDEAGTEAAAATAVVMVKSAAPQPGVTLTIDRPFIFLIRDQKTGTILFLGRVVDPRS